MLFEVASAYNILDPSVSHVAKSAVLFLPAVLNENVRCRVASVGTTFKPSFVKIGLARKLKRGHTDKNRHHLDIINVLCFLKRIKQTQYIKVSVRTTVERRKLPVQVCRIQLGKTKYSKSGQP